VWSASCLLSAMPLGTGLCAVLTAVVQGNSAKSSSALLLVGIGRPVLILQCGMWCWQAMLLCHKHAGFWKQS
jgi:hypothetical protein